MSMRKILIIITWLPCMACFKDSAYNNIKPDDIITISASEGDVLADGSGSGTVAANITSNAAPDRRQVTFKTSMGSFKGGAGDSIVLSPDSGLIVKAQLVSTSVGNAKVTATLRGVTTATPAVVSFVRAYPTGIKVSVDSFVIYNVYSSETLITATMTSANGKPSKGQMVHFKVTYEDGVPVGAFLNNIDSVACDASAKAQIRYSAGEATRLGNLTITASTYDQQGQVIPASTKIYLTKHN